MASGDLASRRICVTGGSGFLGRYVVDRLRASGCEEIFVPRSADYDLVRAADVERLFRDARPQVVVHLAARVGGIHANQESPGRFFYDNLMMGAQVIEAARVHDAEKLVLVGTVCSYPKHTQVPFREEDLWNGYPDETNAAYGIAKKALLVQAQAYRRQYGLNAVNLLCVNLYGPGDDFDSESSHVIPALIRKCCEAVERGESQVEVWGSGSARREFLYVDDAAEGVVLAAGHYDAGEPVNLGSGQEIAIRELAETIAQETGFRGRLVWDPSRPDGQPRRLLDVSRAAQAFGFRARTDFASGLRETLKWYRETARGAAAVRRIGETSGLRGPRSRSSDNSRGGFRL